MARNKNRANNKSGAPAIANKPVKQPAVLKNLFSKVGIELEPELENKLNPEQAAQLAELIETLNKSIVQNEQSQSEISRKQLNLEMNLTDFETRKQRLAQEDNALAKTRKDIEHASTSLLLREEESTNLEKQLIEREANAQAGFILERQSSLASLKHTFTELQQQISELEQQKLKGDVDLIAQQRQQAIAFEAQLQQQLSVEIDQLNAQRISFKKLQHQLKEDQIELNEQKQHYNIEQTKQNLSAQQLRDELTNKFNLEEQQLTQKIESLESFRLRDIDRVKLLQQKIAGFVELEREAKLREFSHPSDVLEYLDNVEQELKEARSKLKGRSETDLEDELAHYKDLADESNETLELMRQDLAEAQSKARKNQRSNREKLELQVQNDVLELHKRTLKVSIDSLKMTLNDLIEKQQSQDAFKELSKMDRKFAEPVAVTSISSLSEFTDELQHRIALAEKDVTLYYDINDLRKFVAGLAMSQLHVFEGISGTGKTSLVKAFAKAVGGHVTTVPVQAGWRDRDDLLGHYNAFEKRYYEKECLQGLYRAHTPSYKNRFNIILLDEMNLSRPEQYFAEFLSAIEMRAGERNVVLMDSSVASPPKYFIDDRWIALANNTWFMGTANHDETTFEFADKTHDRSFMMELKRQKKPSGWQPKTVRKDTIDIESVRDLFEQAVTRHRDEVTELLSKLKHSEFSKVLANDFAIGWGNRFEDQAQRFIAVYIACGGKAIEALEHFLITRILRKGKVLGHFSPSQSKLEKLLEALEKLLGTGCIESAELLLTEIDKAEGVF
jgi:hypothetical protein